jgi:hypothetical protein
MSQDARRVHPSVVPGARPAPSPGFIEPSHPTLRDEAPSGGRWVHEIKFDGYRTQAHLRSGRPVIYTRRAHDWTLRFQPIADALVALSAQDLILDGEVVVNGRGTTAIGAWSPRARAGFPIAARVSWRQIENGTRPDAFTMERPPARGR